MLILKRQNSNDQGSSASFTSPTLTQDHKLQMTLTQLKRINQTKDQLLTKIGHELLTPLNGMMGSLELALKTYQPTQQMQLIQTALKSTHDLHHIIRDIVDLSQLTRGELKVDRKEIQLSRHLIDMLQSAKFEAELKGLQWQLHQEIDLETVLIGDGVRIAHILRNLINNAIKFTEKGSITVALHGHRENTRLMMFKAVIQDTGIGIGEEEQKQIFQTFYQVEEFCNRHHQGSGVGLSLAYLLAKQMRGEISVQSTPGKGSCFEVTIPILIAKSQQQPVDHDAHRREEALKKTQLSAVQKQQAPQKTFIKPAPKLGKNSISLNGNVLIVEDNGVNQMILKGLLNKIGLTAEVADNGAVALETLQQGDFKLVLMDCQMPVMDGLTATREIRKRQGRHQEVPIIAITANVTEQDKKDCFAAGMNDFLNKPITPDTLYPTIMKWIHHQERKTKKKMNE